MRLDGTRPAGYSEEHGGRFDTNQSSMLAHDVELMEGPKKLVHSLIRFQRFDEGSFGRGEPFYAFETGERINEVVETAVNREVGFRIVRFAVARRERAGENVKATADRFDISSRLNIECERAIPTTTSDGTA